MLYLYQMGITSRIKEFFEKRIHFDDIEQWPSVWELLGNFGKTSASGKFVSPSNSLQVSAVYACVKVLAETVASLPWIVYKRLENEGKESQPDHYLFPLLHDSPNEMQTSFEFREMMMGHTLLRGNAYAFKEIDGSGRVVNLIPLDPTRMVVKKEKSVIIYEFTDEDGTIHRWPPAFIWHWRDLSSDGLTGLSRISLAHESVGLSMAAEEHGARFFSNSAEPTGILTTPGKLTEDALKKLRESWQRAQTGINKLKSAVLHGGLKWEKIGLTNEESQFLETRQFQVEDIARIFRVPGVLINHPIKTSTFASAEQFFLSFVVHTIRPWTVRIEQSVLKQVFIEADRQNGIFSEFKIEGILRGDIKTRFEAYAVARNWGWMSVNEIRKLENMNPIDNGDIYLQPLNMVEAGVPQDEPEPGNQDVIDDDDDEFVFPLNNSNGGNNANN